MYGGYGHRGKGGKGKGHGGHGKGKVLPLDLPKVNPPVILTGGSYSYAAKEPYVDILTPAWRSRALDFLPSRVDLRFEALQHIQRPSGGFEVCPLLLGQLGATENEALLHFARSLGNEDLEILGARLVLKAAEVYNIRNELVQASHGVEAICGRCEKLIASSKGRENENESTKVEELLQQSFGIGRGLWSFFELWQRLLPLEILKPLKDLGGLLCTRYFLVDVAGAAWSPYEVDQCYVLFRSGKNVYMGQTPNELNDGMRQGLQLEAAWVKNSQVEEEKNLMALQLPSGQQIIHAAAPDAIDPALAEWSDPLETEADFLGAGYQQSESFVKPTDSAKTCRLWRKAVQSQSSNGNDAPLSAYLEIKKTTHLNGLNGGFKLLKYWLQASLLKVGAVCVAFADAQGVVTHSEKWSISRIEEEIKDRFKDPEIFPKVWASLYASVQRIMHGTGAFGERGLVRLVKRRGFGERLHVDLEDGWGDLTRVMAADPFEVRAAQLF